MKIVFMGTPEFAVPILEKLNELYEIKLVISQPNRVKKKNVFIDTPVAKIAKELNLNLIQPENIKDEYEYIKNIDADLLITAAYGQYVPTKILNLFKKCINVHASILPKHRGGAPIQRCLIEGDKLTGVTIMEMTKKLDAGKIYAIKEYEIKDDDNNTSLFKNLSIIGKDLLIENILDIYNDINKGIPQDDTKATYSYNISKEEERIDLNQSAINVINKIRGLAMEPGAYLDINGTNLKIYSAKIDNRFIATTPGEVLNIKKGITISCKDFPISLELVQMPGKNIISGKDFSNGQKLFKLNDIIS